MSGVIPGQTFTNDDEISVPVLPSFGPQHSLRFQAHAISVKELAYAQTHGLMVSPANRTDSLVKDALIPGSGSSSQEVLVTIDGFPVYTDHSFVVPEDDCSRRI